MDETIANVASGAVNNATQKPKASKKSIKTAKTIQQTKKKEKQVVAQSKKSKKEEKVSNKLAKTKTKAKTSVSAMNKTLEKRKTSKKHLQPAPIQATGAKSNSQVLKRQCLVCKKRVHQDLLSDHCGQHYFESPKCSECDKVSTNSTNYVTHILSHLPSQFNCVKCSLWFRQPITYKRHTAECQITLGDQTEAEMPDEKQRASNGLKRKGSSDDSSKPHVS